MGGEERALLARGIRTFDRITERDANIPLLSCPNQPYNYLSVELKDACKHPILGHLQPTNLLSSYLTR